MDPIRNPYAPGAGQRPPQLAGRDGELQAFELTLERLTRGRPERSLVLTGLRGVGKTVLLNALRSAAVRRQWGTGKLEARPDTSIRRPLAAALHLAVRELGLPAGDEGGQHALGVLKSFALRSPSTGGSASRSGRGATSSADRWQPGIAVPAVAGRADSGDIEIDLVELLADVAGLAADRGRGIALFIDEMQDLAPADVSALCAAVHEIGQLGQPFIVVGAGLPHLPAVLSASKSYSERLFRYARVDRLDRAAADLALRGPARDEAADLTDQALAALYATTAGYPYFVQAYGKAAWDVAPSSPITADDVAVAAPQAEAELAVGFFGSRYERATPAEREYLHGLADVMADLQEFGGPGAAEDGASVEAASQSGATVPDGRADDRIRADDGVPTAAIAERLGRRPQSLSPARDALIKKGLVFSAERGRISFTVPHFDRYLRRSE